MAVYQDQFEVFRAQAKRGSIDVSMLETLTKLSVQKSDYYENSSSAPSSRERTPVRLSASTRSAHARSHSFKVKPTKRAPQDLFVSETMRPRTASMPNCSCNEDGQETKPEECQKDDDEAPSGGGLYRVRSFKTSSKGITNRVDFYKSRSSNTVELIEGNNNAPVEAKTVEDPELARLKTPERRSSSRSPGRRPGSLKAQNSQRNGHRATYHQQGDHLAPPLPSTPIVTQGNYHSIMMGSAHVGKTALVKQFMTSEFLGGYARSISIDEETQEKSISVLLDGIESFMSFLELAPDEDYKNYDEPDCYVVIYSVDDRGTFDHAVDLLYTIRKHQVREVALILVANKADLERTRVVSTDEGREAAITYECKFIETSVALNHRVDDLLVGCLSQIRLTPKRAELRRKKSKLRSREGLARATKGLLDKLFRKSSVSRSAEDLLSV